VFDPNSGSCGPATLVSTAVRGVTTPSAPGGPESVERRRRAPDVPDPMGYVPFST